MVSNQISATTRAGATNDALYKELWHACAGPLVTLPREGDRVYYFPQGHMEQLQASMNQGLEQQMPSFNLPSKILCKVVNIHLRAETETDEVYAQITLLPESDQSEVTSPDDPLPEPPRCTVHSFCKTLTASDTSTHGSFFVLRRHADDCLPSLGKVWDWLFKSCEVNGRIALRDGLINVKEIEECISKGNCKILSSKLPAWSLLQCLLTSAKSNSDGLVISDDVELTRMNGPNDKVFEWFIGPLLTMKDQLKNLELEESEETCLKELVMRCKNDIPEDWDSTGFPSNDNVRRAQLQAIIRRL